MGIMVEQVRPVRVQRGSCLIIYTARGLLLAVYSLRNVGGLYWNRTSVHGLTVRRSTIELSRRNGRPTLDDPDMDNFMLNEILIFNVNALNLIRTGVSSD